MAKKRKSSSQAKRNLVPKHIIRYSVGPLLDVCQGDYIKNPKGDYVMLGYIGSSILVAGLPDHYKTSFIMSLSVILAKRYASEGTHPVIEHLDTESTAQWYRHEGNFIKNLGKGVEELKAEGTYNLSSKAVGLFAEQWWKNILDDKDERTSKETEKLSTAFYDFDGKFIKQPKLKIHLIDSLSDFSTEKSEEIFEEGDITDGDKKTIGMHESNYKNQIISKLNHIGIASGMTFIATCHCKKQIKVDRYEKNFSLPALPNGIHLVRVSTQAAYSFTTILYIGSCDQALDANKKIKYPRPERKHLEFDDELKEITVRFIRSKQGTEYFEQKFLMSTIYGLEMDLSNFNHLLSERKGYGLINKKVGYQFVFSCKLYPEVEFTRLTIRGELDTNKYLARALELTVEIDRILFFKPYLVMGLETDLDKIIEKLTLLGYTQDEILNTRSYPTYNHYEDLNPPPMTGLDLINMANGKYIPWWLDSKRQKEITDNLSKLTS